MTAEEIKQAYSMRDIVERYGVKVNRAGMCCCPIHGEKNPSMKIYKDSFNCFACGAHGDIFTFVQKLDHCDFKTAFYSFGGEYKEQKENERILANKRREKQKKERLRAEQTEREVEKEVLFVLNTCKLLIEEYEPYTDIWTLCQNTLPFIDHIWQMRISGEGVNVPDVHRVCARFRREIIALGRGAR